MSQIIDTGTQHTISLLVNNKPGVLIRIALVFARRGFNLDSVVVSPGMEERFSRMTITASGEPEALVRILQQLNKLVDVIHAIDHTGEVVVERELALIKISCPPTERTDLLQISDHFKCASVDISQDHLTLECTGSTEKLDALMEMVRPFGIIEMVRTGKIVVTRGVQET